MRRGAGIFHVLNSRRCTFIFINDRDAPRQRIEFGHNSNTPRTVRRVKLFAPLADRAPLVNVMFVNRLGHLMVHLLRDIYQSIHITRMYSIDGGALWMVDDCRRGD